MGLIAQGPSRTQRAVIVIVGVVPSLIVAVCGVVALSMWRDELPDLIASHWNSNGVDGTTSVTAGLVIVLVTGVVGMARVSRRHCAWASRRWSGSCWAR